MKITINENCENDEIIVNCKQLDERILRLLSLLKDSDKKLSGTIDGKTYLLDPNDVFYFEGVDKKTFIYTKQKVYETPLKLYEIEEKRFHENYFRASKSIILNLSKVSFLTPTFSQKLEATLENKEKIHISRQYVKLLKERLGV